METKQNCVVKLTSTSTKGFLFSAFSDDGKEKYLGEISKDHKSDSCSCMGNTMGNICYHIKDAHSKMEGFW